MSFSGQRSRDAAHALAIATFSSAFSHNPRFCSGREICQDRRLADRYSSPQKYLPIALAESKFPQPWPLPPRPLAAPPAQGANLVDFGSRRGLTSPLRGATSRTLAIAAIEANFTRYTVVPGIPDVRKAIVDRHACDFGSDYTIDEAVFTSGGKLALFNTIQVLIDHGDEVILPVPYWVSFKDISPVRGRQGSCSSKQAKRKVSASRPTRLSEAITPRTKAIILEDSPSNPASSVVSAEDAGGGSFISRTTVVFFCFSTSALRLPQLRGQARVSGRLVHMEPRSTSSFSAHCRRPTPMTNLASGIRAGRQESGRKPEHKLQSQSTSNATSFCAEGRDCGPDRLAGVRSRVSRRVH